MLILIKEEAGGGLGASPWEVVFDIRISRGIFDITFGPILTMVPRSRQAAEVQF